MSKLLEWVVDNIALTIIAVIAVITVVGGLIDNKFGPNPYSQSASVVANGPVDADRFHQVSEVSETVSPNNDSGYIVRKAERKADDIVKSAKAEAKQIVVDAHKEANEIKKHARQAALTETAKAQDAIRERRRNERNERGWKLEVSWQYTGKNSYGDAKIFTANETLKFGADEYSGCDPAIEDVHNSIVSMNDPDARIRKAICTTPDGNKNDYGRLRIQMVISG